MINKWVFFKRKKTLLGIFAFGALVRISPPLWSQAAGQLPILCSAGLTASLAYPWTLHIDGTPLTPRTYVVRYFRHAWMTLAHGNCSWSDTGIFHKKCTAKNLDSKNVFYRDFGFF
jgi:hypothetical protein